MQRDLTPKEAPMLGRYDHISGVRIPSAAERLGKSPRWSGAPEPGDSIGAGRRPTIELTLLMVRPDSEARRMLTCGRQANRHGVELVDFQLGSRGRRLLSILARLRKPGARPRSDAPAYLSAPSTPPQSMALKGR
jgi:hypothetical protein